MTFGYSRLWPGIRAEAGKKVNPLGSLRQRQRRSAKPTLAQVLGEVGVALVALGILAGAAIALPVWLPRPYGIGLTAAILIASIVVFAKGHWSR